MKIKEESKELLRTVIVNITQNNNYEGQSKCSLADQDTLMECDQMKFIFQNHSPCGPHTSSTSVVVLGSHWSKYAINSRYVIIIYTLSQAKFLLHIICNKC